jgi:hypothetical protein
MASQPKPDPKRFLTIDELWAIRGTPEFEAEYKRQLSAIAQHDRETRNADRMPVDWEALDKVWK